MLTTLQRIPRRKFQISVAEREVQVQMEGSWHTESNFLKEIKFGAIQTATGPPVIAEGYQDNGSPIITAVVGLSAWNRTQQGF